MLQHFTEGLKYSFFPYTILEWNNLDKNILQSKTIYFSDSLLKIGRPTPKPFYNMHNPNGLKLLTRLKLSSMAVY